MSKVIRVIYRITAVFGIIFLSSALLTNRVSAAESSNQIKTIDHVITDPTEITEYLKTNFPQNTVTSREIDIYKSAQKRNTSSLVKRGYSVDAANDIANQEFNNQLLELANETEDTLQDYGYTDKQIASIKQYDGNENAIEYISRYSLSNATVTCSFGPTLINNTNQFNIYYSAVWSSCPLFQLQDIIGLGWIACNEFDIPISMYVETTTGFGQYYNPDGTYHSIRDLSVVGDSHGLNVKIPMGIGPHSNYYAKVISGRVSMRCQGNSGLFRSIQVNMTYGHQTWGVTPSIKYTLGSNNVLGIQLSTGLSDEYRETRVYWYDGTQI